MRGKLRATRQARGAILRGLRDYSWPVNIDSASSGATAQPGSTVFRARREARRVAESGPLSPGGRGQGEDVSSVICSKRLPAAARGEQHARRRLRGGQQGPRGCTEHLPWGWRDGARTHASSSWQELGEGSYQPWLLQSLSCWERDCRTQPPRSEGTEDRLGAPGSKAGLKQLPSCLLVLGTLGWSTPAWGGGAPAK